MVRCCSSQKIDEPNPLWGMDGSSSSTTDALAVVGDDNLCKNCRVVGTRKVSQSSANPGKPYLKCSRCNKFIRWLSDKEDQQAVVVKLLEDIKAESSQRAEHDRLVLKMLTEMKAEMNESRVAVKMLEKGQSMFYLFVMSTIVALVMFVAFGKK